jgi:hypothetical protein
MAVVIVALLQFLPESPDVQSNDCLFGGTLSRVVVGTGLRWLGLSFHLSSHTTHIDAGISFALKGVGPPLLHTTLSTLPNLPDNSP